jgi:predicted porin
MKKTLIAVAALVATGAFAQSLTIYGTVDAGYSSVITTNPTAAAWGTTAAATETKVVGYANNPGTSGAMTSNRLGFKGEEDLGAGLKAGFTYELGLNYATGASGLGGTTRQSFISLTDANLGGVSIGRQYTPIFSAGAAYDAGGTNNMVAGRTVYTKHTTVYEAATTKTAPDSFTRANGVMYTSPTIAGVTVKLLTAKDTTTNNDAYAAAATTGVAASRTDTGASIDYANGPLRVTFGNHTYKNLDAYALGNSGNTETKGSLLGASYDFGVAKVMAMTSDSKSSQQGAQFYAYKGIQLGVQAPIGAKVSTFATYGTGKSDTTSGVRGYDHKAYQLGASYALSKRTNAYFGLGNEVATRVSANQDVTIKQTIFGLRHSF